MLIQGDDDPIDVCDLSTGKKNIGDVYRGKILGCFCLIDQGELDWKILVVDAEEA
jgi:inorganic pyrophosphatase